MLIYECISTVFLIRPHIEVRVIVALLVAVYAELVLDPEVRGDKSGVLVLLRANQAVLH